MYFLIICIFLLGYTAIAFEHSLKIDKAATALFTAVALWTTLAMIGIISPPSIHPGSVHLDESIIEHLGEISGILFFLLGAMTLVEIVDIHGGFDVITSRITTKNKTRLFWLLSFITFFMSAALDNLTTSIVMATLLRKIISDKRDLWLFAGMIVIAANAGGVWSPIGDVTTIMLWIGKQVTAGNIILKLFIPSLVCMIVPLILISRRIKGELPRIENSKQRQSAISDREKKIVLYMGVGALLFVPIFKTITHLPPVMGILLGLSVVWITTEILHRNKSDFDKKDISIVHALRKIDISSILFFLGILLAVSALQFSGHLNDLAVLLDEKIGNIWVINSLIGVFSAIVDNVPLVAGTIGMYDLSVYPQDHTFWELLAYCAGTGGSILIIGSAAGVAIMGILKIDFFWYVKQISLYAFLGYLAGILSFLLLESIW